MSHINVDLAGSAEPSIHGGLRIAESGMDAVEVTDAGLRNAAELEIDYLLSFDPDRLLVEFRKNAGLDTFGKKNYGGWEAGRDAVDNGLEDPRGVHDTPQRFTGHFVGHYVSAISEMQRATFANAEQKTRLADALHTLVGGIREAQQRYTQLDPANAGFLPAFEVEALPGGKDGLFVPFYNLHKVEQGMVDAAKFAADEQTRDMAKAAAVDFAGFIVRWKAAHPDVDMLAIEYGGMNDALYQLAEITDGDARATALRAAHLFDEDTLFETLASGVDNLDGKHANTTIPKLTGAVQRYVAYTQDAALLVSLSQADRERLTGVYLKAAEYFWDTVTARRSYVNGDNSQSEHFHVAGELWKDATANGDRDDGYHNNSTSETCNANNMLKLTRLLFQITGDAKYSAYYEHTFINTILASQNPRTGMTMYFHPMKAGYAKIFGTRYGEFWCCQGTGIENFSKLNDSFYFVDDDAVYVNLLIASTFDDRRHGLRITQAGNLPKRDTVTFTVSSLDGMAGSASSDRVVLKLRVPYWCAAPTLTVDGREVPAVPDGNGWVNVPIQDGTVVAYRLPASVQAVPAPDNAHWVAFQYGPSVLAGALAPTDPATNYDRGGVLVRMSRYDAAAADKAVIVPQGMSEDEWLADVGRHVVRVDDPDDGGDLRFALRDVAGPAAGVPLQPYRTLSDSSYALYWDVMAVGSDVYRRREEARREAERIAAITLDEQLTFDNQAQNESAKGLRMSADSTAGSRDGEQYRIAGEGGWFSYDLSVGNTGGMNTGGMNTGVSGEREQATDADRVYLATRYRSGDAGLSYHVTVAPLAVGTENAENAEGADGVGIPGNGALPVDALQFDVTIDDGAAEGFHWQFLNITDAARSTGGKVRVTYAPQPSADGRFAGVYGVRITAARF